MGTSVGVGVGIVIPEEFLAEDSNVTFGFGHSMALASAVGGTNTTECDVAVRDFCDWCDNEAMRHLEETEEALLKSVEELEESSVNLEYIDKFASLDEIERVINKNLEELEKGLKILDQIDEALANLTKIEEAMNDLKKTEEAMSNLEEMLKQEHAHLMGQSRHQLERHLMAKEWYLSLKDDQKVILIRQAEFLLRQKSILQSVNLVLSQTSRLQRNIDLRNIQALYGEDVSNLNDIHRFFKNMNKDELGRVVKNPNSDEFMQVANDPNVGLKLSMTKVVQMLTGGHPRQPQSLWEVNQGAFCNKEAEGYFASLLVSSFVLKRIALAMEGDAMAVENLDAFKRDLELIRGKFNAECSCAAAEWKGHGKHCYRVAHINHANDVFGSCQDECEKGEGLPASIHSEAENAFIGHLIDESDNPTSDTLVGRLLRASPTTGGDLVGRWADDTRAHYTNWMPHRGPDGALDALDDCVFVDHDTKGWFSADCLSPPLVGVNCACKRRALSSPPVRQLPDSISRHYTPPCTDPSAAAGLPGPSLLLPVAVFLPTIVQMSLP